MVTCYDAWTAKILNKTAVDCLLVGDSLAVVMHGFPSTVHATVPMMAMHVAAVARGAPDKFIVADMPFMSCSKNKPNPFSYPTRCTTSPYETPLTHNTKKDPSRAHKGRTSYPARDDHRYQPQPPTHPTFTPDNRTKGGGGAPVRPDTMRTNPTLLNDRPHAHNTTTFPKKNPTHQTDRTNDSTTFPDMP